MTPVIRTETLSKYYGDARGVIDLDLEVEAGEIFGFIGPNGAGKTTTIRLLLDFIRPTSGRAEIFGLDANESSVEIRRRVGYVPGDLQLFDRLTGAELLAWLDRLRTNHDPAWVTELAERMSLDLTRAIGDLSTGNRQKVGIVQAFMHRPELLILDEPTSGLDPLVRRSFRDLVAEVAADGATVFLSSHVLAEVEDICDRVATVVDGRLRRLDTVADLKAESRRRVRATIAGPVEPSVFGQLPGVDQVKDLVESVRGDTTVVELEITGELDTLVKALARFRVVDLISEPMSLEAVFLESYDDGDGQAVAPATASAQDNAEEMSRVD